MDEDIVPFQSVAAASIAAEAYIEKLKSAVQIAPTPSSTKNDDLITTD
jgi:hypothetical protein